MKRMWSEEEVNAAIAEYAATHPAGGKLYLHKIVAEGTDGDTYTMNVHFSVITNSNTPFTSFIDVPSGGYAVESGTFNDGEDLGYIITISVDNGAGLFLNYYVSQFSQLEWNYGYTRFLDEVSEL